MMDTIREVPHLENKENAGERMMRIFEEEMLLGPNINNHIPSFIAEGLAQLKSLPNFVYPTSTENEEEKKEG